MKLFKGYYVKCVGQKDSVAVIFGRQVYKKEKSSFIQIITKENSYSVTFANAQGKKTDKFIFRKNRLEAKVDKNFANKNEMFLDIDSPKLTAKGRVAFGEFAKIKYDAMGPLKFLPLMECRHTIVSMRHTIAGQIIINGQVYDFDGGIGYIEGDRGRSFPTKYFWSQCNGEGASVSASAAVIPYMGISFMGTICVIRYNGAEHRFASYLGARVKQMESKRLLIEQRKKQLEIEVLDDIVGQPLLAPVSGRMSRTIEESLVRTIRYKFVLGDKVLFDFISDRASHEYSTIK